jgi:hypothetical protein
MKMPDSVFGIPFKHEIDLGHFLTFLTLAAGFAWWLYKTWHDWRTAAKRESRSGAIRLLLHLLRQEGKPIALDDLAARFASDPLRPLRKAYCHRNFKFKNRSIFEAAIYALDSEGKVDFWGPHSVAFHVDRNPEADRVTAQPLSSGIALVTSDVSALLEVLRRGVEDEKRPLWELREFARNIHRALPNETASLIRNELESETWVAKSRAADLLASLARDGVITAQLLPGDA